MFDQIKSSLTGKKAKQLTDPRNIGLYIFGIVVVAIAWSGAKTVQNNYTLQKQLAEIKQQNDLLWLQKQNIYLQNQYYKTDQYLELSARQNLGMAAPGEQVLLVPQKVAMSYVNRSLYNQPAGSAANNADQRSKYVRNLEAWRDFLLGR